MTPLVANLNYLLAIGTIAMQVGVVYLLYAYFTRKSDVLPFISKYALPVTFILSLSGAVLTLIYSEIFGFIPCGLCWFERVFLYPIVLLSGIALWKKDSGIADYILGLSTVGALIALYHHYIQMGGSAFIACPAVGAGADCAKRIIFEFGYITFPLMAFSLFAFIGVMMLIARRKG